MTTSKRHREKNFATSTSALIETSTTNISQTTESKESSQVNQLVNSEKSKLIQNHFEIITKTKHTNDNITKTIVDRTQINNEDDWVLFNLKKK
jgi:hypothetical protein